jgi:membrane protein CcdC involved in cytochrome C biogenesis
MQVHQAPGMMQYLIPLLIAGVVIALRVRRMSQMRPLKIERLWIVPAIYLALVTFLYFKGPPSPIGWAICVATLLLGGVVGWQRGKMMQIHVDPETHAINQKGSFAAIIFLVVLFAVKFAAQTGTEALHVNVAVLTDALAALALGMFTMTRVEMYLRAKRLLEAARA